MLLLLPVLSWAQCVNNPPINFTATATSPTSFTVSVDPEVTATIYRITYRGTGTWKHDDDANMPRTITGLTSGVTYTVRVRTKCGNRWSKYTADLLVELCPDGPCEEPTVCADGTPLTTPGTACDDGDPNTINDVIQADGCDCQGEQAPVCPDGSPNKTPGTACNDGNPDTENDVIQADNCTCAGTPTPAASLWTTGTGMIYRNGKVVVGTVTTAIPADYMLYVNGGVLTEKVKVALQTGNWSDFVFEKDYHRNSIPYVETYIKENKHLPNVPSAKEVGENGIDLGQMDATLLRQIEELWLNVIDLNKENKDLRVRNESLNKKLEILEKTVNTLVENQK